MKDLLTDLEQSKQLKKLGVTQKSNFAWINMTHKHFDADKYYLGYQFAEDVFTVVVEKKDYSFHLSFCKSEMNDCISCFTSQELWDMMKSENYHIEQQFDKICFNGREGVHLHGISETNDIEARFKMLSFLLKENILEVKSELKKNE
jgi:hypothetical protein